MSPEYAKKYFEAKRATVSLEEFNGKVMVVHGDGSNMVFHNAFLEEHAPLILVFTEHCGYFYFYIDDLDMYSYSKYKEENDAR